MFTKKHLVSAIALGLLTQTGMVAAEEADTTSSLTENPEVIQVRGIKGSLNKALNIKRNEFQLVDAIVAEDIGKFPDNNVVEALQRVTGVQTTGRGAGEVSTISIRGLTDVNTTINGRAIFTGAGRAVALQDIPASLISQVDVFKTRSAAEIENGIAGSLDVKTQRPFNFDGSKVILAGRGIYSDQPEKMDPNLSMLMSNRWDLGDGEFGALVNISYAETHYRDMNIASGAFFPFNSGTGTSVLTPYQRIFTDWTPGTEAGLDIAEGSTMNVGGVDHEYLLSRDAMIATDVTGLRKRPAANISLQWAPNDEWEFVAEAFYNGYRNESSTAMNFDWADAWWDTRVADESNVEIYDGTNIVKSRSVYSSSGYSSGDGTQDKTDSWLFALGGKWYASDNLTMDAEVVYQKSKYTTEFYGMRFDRAIYQMEVDFNDKDGIPSIVHYDNPETTADESNLADPTLWTTGFLYNNGGSNSGDAVSFTLDGEWILDGDIFENLRFGGRVDLRTAEATTRPVKDAGWYYASLADFQSLLPNEGKGFVNKTTGFFDGRANIPQSYLSADAQYIFDHADLINDIYGVSIDPDYKTFSIDETGIALYATSNFRLTNDIDGEVGLRYVSYSQDMNFWDAAANEGSADASTTKLLPSLALRWSALDDVMVRFAYSQTLRMPAFADLNSYVYYGEDLNDSGYGTASSGNSDLQPTVSYNYDLGVEWYFAEASSLYGTLFRRDIDGFVITSNTTIYDDTIYDGTEKFILTSPQNASDGVLQGLEIGGVWFPSDLPDALDGFGIQASVTFLDSEQDYPVLDDTATVTGYETYDVAGVSDLSYSLVLAYDNNGVGARLSYVWRDDFYIGSSGTEFAHPRAVYGVAERDLSFQVSYDVTDDLMITFDATNLLDDVYQTYYGEGRSTTMNANSAIFSRTFAVGVRYSL